ncbi:hypothetical protein SAMN05443549_103325 [Flavobacterium fluvii]|uniref:Uncharacterized protein n=1 Tax=Flavobacterium fluvii TaxID=468056 RepID=A0A1M5J0Z5_9FLAO|nr:hypothetical protein [Flavobacterium fluvii]SHG34247.1 hypothetical protein SAMN05443549_103325 [Flavobacterium fluvii]
MSKMETENGTQENALKPKKLNLGKVSIVVMVLVLLGIGTYGYFNCCDVDQNKNLGTYDDPEVAFRETQKALSILSGHLKIGIESVQYIQEYDNSKNLIFKPQKSK